MVALACVTIVQLVLPLDGLSAQEAGRISNIIVQGNQRIEATTVRSYMRLRPGDPFDPALIDQSLKALFATGLFADVTIRQQGTAIVVSVVENPIINRLAFEGNKTIDDDALRAEVQLRPRVVFTRTRVQTDAQRLIELYRRSGRFAATVEPKVIQLPQNRIDLVFEINEGPKTKVRSIRFVGNRAFSDGTLRGAIATVEARFWRILTTNDTYDPDRLNVDRELLRSFYLARGYADFRVVSAVAELTPDRDEFFITFTVEEGEIYRFGTIELDTELKDLDPEELRALVLTEEGDTYNAELIEQTIEDITFELGRRGYAFVDIRPRVRRDREQRTIALIYDINEGPRVYVERIDITGNVRTLDKVIRREFRLVEGDAFNTAKLRRSRARIRGLDFFENVEITNEAGSEPDKTVVIVDVKEKATGQLSFGAGFSTTEALIGDISIQERNLIGRGQSLRLGLGLSAIRRQIDLSFTEPYFLDKPVSAGIDLFNIRLDQQRESSFDQASTGMALRTGYAITERLRQSWTYTLRRDNITDVDENASRFIREQEGATLTSAIGYALTYDRRDDPIDPREGFVTSFAQRFAGLGGDVRNVRTTLSHSHYFPIYERIVFNLAARGGYIFGLDQDVRIDQRFFVGGDDFRGFERAGIGPRDTTTSDALGGNIFYVGTAELSFPVGLPEEFGILGRVFSEAGSLWMVDDSGPEIFDTNNVRVSAGVGLSWRSPFGPVRIDFAKVIRKENVDRTEAFRFSFGTRF